MFYVFTSCSISQDLVEISGWKQLLEVNTAEFWPLSSRRFRFSLQWHSQLGFEGIFIFTTYFWIIWGVILDNPVHLRNIQSSGSYISAQQNSRFCITELEKCCSTFCLFLLALKQKKQIKQNKKITQRTHKGCPLKKKKTLPVFKLKCNLSYYITAKKKQKL